MLTLTCPKCGNIGPKHEFSYLSRAESAGAETYRKCPRCNTPVFCNEVDDSYAEGKVWGTSNLRGFAFTKKNLPPRGGEKS